MRQKIGSIININDISYWPNVANGYYSLEEANKILEQVEKDLHILNSDAPFKRLFEDEEETFNKKPTGNRVLGRECTFCAYKKTCWENLEYLPQQQSKAINPKYYWYTKVDNRKEEHDDS